MKYLVPLPSQLLVKWVGPVREHRTTRILVWPSFCFFKKKTPIECYLVTLSVSCFIYPKMFKEYKATLLLGSFLDDCFSHPPGPGEMSFGAGAYRWRCFKRNTFNPFAGSVPRASLDGLC